MGVATAFGITAALFAIVVLSAHQHAEFAFDDAVMFVGVIDDAFARFNVLIEWFVAGVDHHAGKAFIDAFLAQFEGVAVVQVDRDGDIGKADSGFNELFEIGGIGV